MHVRKLDRLQDHAIRAPCLRRQHHLGAEKAHQLAPFNAELLCHGHHQRVPLRGAYHGKADTRVSAGRLDDRLPRL